MISDCASMLQYLLLVSNTVAIDSLLSMKVFGDGHTVFTPLHKQL